MPEKHTGSSPGWDPQLEALAAEAHGPVPEQTSPEPGDDERERAAHAEWWKKTGVSSSPLMRQYSAEAWLEQARRCREREAKLRQALERVANLDRIDCVVTVSRLRDEARAALAGSRER